MRSIAIINQKGGVGKTTTSVNLSAALARAGHRVCLIDLDPQAHASLHLGLALEDGDPSIYNVLTGQATIGEVRHAARENLWVAPSHLDLAAAEMELAGEVGRELILRDALQADDESFDFVILDCPPSLGVLTLNALTAAREVFIPLQPHFLALHGLSKLLQTLDIVAKRLNQNLQLSGIVFCMYETGTRLAAEVSGDVEEFLHGQRSGRPVWSNAQALKTRIRRNIRLAEAPSYGQSIFDYDATCHGAEDYQQLAAEVLAASEEATPVRVA